jgi:nucleotide-binding universal stress UspA family protein
VNRDHAPGSQQAPGRRTPQLVVGYDQHPASHQAVLVAAALAQILGATLLLVHVIDLADYPIDPEAATWESGLADTLLAERRQAETLLASTGIGWSYRIVQDNPVHALAEVAHEVDALFIVVGASGRGLAQRLLHGSVPQALFRRQRKPVLVVPAQTPRQPSAR